MNELPDDLRAIEANLSQLSPTSSIDTDRLIFESGYAAALADRNTSPPARTMVTIVGSALVGMAATLLAVFALRPQDPSLPPSAAIPGDRQQQDAPPMAPRGESSRLAEKASWPTTHPRPSSTVNSFIEPSDVSYGALHWRQRLLKSTGDGAVAMDIQPDPYPSARRINEPRVVLPTNLQWQRELLRDDSSRERVNS